MSKICKKCGRVMRDNARFCMTCGTSLLPDQPAEKVKEEVIEADIKEEITEISEPEVNSESVTSKIKETIEENTSETVENEAPETETAVSGTEAPEKEDTAEDSELDIQPPKKKIKPWIWIAAGILVIGAAVAVLAITGVFSA